MLIQRLLTAFSIIAAANLTGCASIAGPVETGTITQATATFKTVSKPSATGAVVGGAAGGVLGHQIGKGNGKKVATVAGVLLGSVVGAVVASEDTQVPAMYVVIADDITGRLIGTTLDGRGWQIGMKVRYSTYGPAFVLRD